MPCAQKKSRRTRQLDARVGRVAVADSGALALLNDAVQEPLIVVGGPGGYIRAEPCDSPDPSSPLPSSVRSPPATSLTPSPTRRPPSPKRTRRRSAARPISVVTSAPPRAGTATRSATRALVATEHQSGRFAIDAPQIPSDVAIEIAAPGFVPRRLSPEEFRAETPVKLKRAAKLMIRVHLDPGVPPAAVGFVVEGPATARVEGAPGSRRVAVATDASGFVSFEELQSGRADLRVVLRTPGRPVLETVRDVELHAAKTREPALIEVDLRGKVPLRTLQLADVEGRPIQILPDIRFDGPACEIFRSPGSATLVGKEFPEAVAVHVSGFESLVVPIADFGSTVTLPRERPTNGAADHQSARTLRSWAGACEGRIDACCRKGKARHLAGRRTSAELIAADGTVALEVSQPGTYRLVLWSGRRNAGGVFVFRGGRWRVAIDRRHRDRVR